MTAEPDAWDECGGCGHDRDDHVYGTCATCLLDGDARCCPAFEEPA